MQGKSKRLLKLKHNKFVATKEFQKHMDGDGNCAANASSPRTQGQTNGK